mmetsp:Transcript_119092/g.342201  ORF Transcript_119092/g.342201 Transcript_119092/m.342201 type:complete len:310 (+) Transcript_119092:1025-1954(+)
MRGLPEDVAVHKLPPGLLGGLLHGHVVVLGDVAVQRPEEDHRDHAGEEEDDHQGIHDREPVDLPLVHPQVHVPARRPTNRAWRPCHIIGVNNGVVLGQVEARREVVGVVACRLHSRSSLLGGLHQALRVDFESDDTETVELLWIDVVLEADPDVVVHVVLVVALDAHWEAVRVRVAIVAAPIVAHGGGQIVDKPIHRVIMIDHPHELPLLLLAQLPLAQVGARGVLVHFQVVHRILDGVAEQDLAKVLGGNVDRGWLAVRENVVAVGELGLDRCQLVHLQVHLGAFRILSGRHAGQVECFGMQHCERRH